MSWDNEQLLRSAATRLRDDWEREDVDDLEAAEIHLATSHLLDWMANYAVAQSFLYSPSGPDQWLPVQVVDVAKAVLQ